MFKVIHKETGDIETVYGAVRFLDLQMTGRMITEFLIFNRGKRWEWLRMDDYKPLEEDGE